MRIRTAFGALAAQVVRPVLAGKDCDGDDLGLPPWQDFHVWEQPGFDGIGDQAGRTFFLHHRVAHAAHCPGGVFDADRQLAASRVGRGDQGAQHARRVIVHTPLRKAASLMICMA